MKTLISLLAAAFLFAGGAAANAQQLVGSFVQLGQVNHLDFATGIEGDVMGVGDTQSGDTRTFWYEDGTLSLRGGDFVDRVTNDDAAITALARGGYAVAWRFFNNDDGTSDVRVRRADAHGQLLGSPIPAGVRQEFPKRIGIAAHGDGFVAAWSDQARIYTREFDASGGAMGGPVDIGPCSLESDVELRALPNGGVLAVWQGEVGGVVRARVLGPGLVPVADAFQVFDGFKATDVAVSPDGAVAAVVGSPAMVGTTPPTRLLMRVFALDQSFVSGEIDVRTLATGDRMAAPAVAFGAGGDLLVLWGERAAGLDGTYGRLFDASGAPSGPIRTLAAVTVPSSVRAARRADGTFFVTWSYSNSSAGVIVTICAPGTSVCGDGTLTSTCEVCDAGAANSDVVPDACRTDCQPPHCGDGVTDGGESCDDGNRDACDGCNELCEVEAGTTCGDGVAAPSGCGEQCDDGNGVAGDGCSAACAVERVLGGGSPASDCYAAWHVDNPSNDPRYDKRGNINGRQRCVDDDPACDFDGGVPGSCTFHLGVCVNNSGLQCLPARLLSWELRTPSAKQALTRPPLAAVRSALAAAVVPTVVGSGDADACSPYADVVVPLRGTPGAYKVGKLTLKSLATVYSGASDTDKIVLRCVAH